MTALPVHFGRADNDELGPEAGRVPRLLAVMPTAGGVRVDVVVNATTFGPWAVSTPSAASPPPR